MSRPAKIEWTKMIFVLYQVHIICLQITLTSWYTKLIFPLQKKGNARHKIANQIFSMPFGPERLSKMNDKHFACVVFALCVDAIFGRKEKVFDYVFEYTLAMIHIVCGVKSVRHLKYQNTKQHIWAQICSLIFRALCAIIFCVYW